MDGECSHEWQTQPDIVITASGILPPAACRHCGRGARILPGVGQQRPTPECRFRGPAGRMLDCDSGEHTAMFFPIPEPK